MKLAVFTPLATIVQTEDAHSVRAADASGVFGILPGHIDFLTALAICVLTWRDSLGQEHYVAVRGGALSIERGAGVSVATPEAIAGEDLHQLEAEVLDQFRRHVEEERAARTDSERLRLAAIRQIIRLLRPQARWEAPPGFTVPGSNASGEF